MSVQTLLIVIPTLSVPTPLAVLIAETADLDILVLGYLDAQISMSAKLLVHVIHSPTAPTP